MTCFCTKRKIEDDQFGLEGWTCQKNQKVQIETITIYHVTHVQAL